MVDVNEDRAEETGLRVAKSVLSYLKREHPALKAQMSFDDSLRLRRFVQDAVADAIGAN